MPKEKKEEVKEIKKVEPAELKVKAGTCELIFYMDERGRPTIEAFCPADDKGMPAVSAEARWLSDAFHSPEVVLKTPKIIKEEEEK